MKVSGPEWLTVGTGGTLSGTPGDLDVGVNTFIVQVDAAGGSDTANLNIKVFGSPNINGDTTVNLVDFATVAANWLDDTCVGPTWCDGADFNIDGII